MIEDIGDLDHIKFGSLESLIPGLQTEGLTCVRSGLYISAASYPEDTRSSDQPISEHVINKLVSDPTQIAKLAGHIRGKTVVDLGAGKTSNGYQLALLCEAAGYVANEANYFSELRDVLGKMHTPKSRNIPACVVGEDMRNFVQRVPNNSVIVFAIGIDGHILDNRFKIPPKGVRELSENIAKIVSAGGVYVGSDTSIPAIGLQDISPRRSGYTLWTKSA